MLPSYFDYIFGHLRQKVRLRPELSPKFFSTLGPSPVRLTTLLWIKNVISYSWNTVEWLFAANSAPKIYSCLPKERSKESPSCRQSRAIPKTLPKKQVVMLEQHQISGDFFFGDVNRAIKLGIIYEAQEVQCIWFWVVFATCIDKIVLTF